MFRDFLKMSLRYRERSNFWNTSDRMREAVKVNSKPHIELSVLRLIKPPKSTSPRPERQV